MHFVLVLNKTAIKDVSRCAKPGGFQMRPSSGSGTPFWAHPLESHNPQGCWYGQSDCSFCRCQEWNWSVHQMCWTQPWHTCELFYVTGEQIEAATKALSTKGRYSSTQSSLLHQVCAGRVGMRRGWNIKPLKRVYWCHKTASGFRHNSLFHPFLPPTY